MSRRIRQYVGLALLVVAYVGGIIGWTWATLQIDKSEPAPPDTTQVRTDSSQLSPPQQKDP